MGTVAPLQDWTIVVLRPAATRAPLLHAFATTGARLLALPVLRIRPAADRGRADAGLRKALAAPVVVFTSPAAVQYAAGLPCWHGIGGERAVAVGGGTAAALDAAGVPGAWVPGRSDSEGVLALPLLQAPAAVGLVTAPGGRGLIAATLQQRGVPVWRADVYRRVPAPLRARRRALLASAVAGDAPVALLLSSAEALQQLLEQAPAEAGALLQRALVVAASARLDALARQMGAVRVARAGDASPAALRAAVLAYAAADAIR